MHVAAQHTVKPDARLLADVNVADNLRAGFDEGSQRDLRRDAFVDSDHNRAFARVSHYVSGSALPTDKKRNPC